MYFTPDQYVWGKKKNDDVWTPPKKFHPNDWNLQISVEQKYVSKKIRTEEKTSLIRRFSEN